MLAPFRFSLAVWALGTLVSTIAAVPWNVPQGRRPRETGEDCRRVATSFVQILGHDSHEIPHKKAKDDELEVCQTTDHRKSCCTRSVERHLQRIAVNDMREIMISSSRHLIDLLAVNSALYRNEYLKLMSVSKNATKSTLLSTSLKLPSSDVESAIDHLFLDLGRSMQQDAEDVEVTISRFFDSLFASVFVHTISNSDGSLVPPAQRTCFRNARRDLSPSPFAHSVNQLSRDLGRALGIVRILLDAFDLALEVINTTTHERFEHECSLGLTRLLYCSYCQGHAEIRPCRNLCMSVIDGCLASLADLNVQWNLFVSAVEGLVLSTRGTDDLQGVLGTFHSKVSDGILRTMETTQKYHSQLVSRCGPIVRVSQPEIASTKVPARLPAAKPPESFRRRDGQPPPSTRSPVSEVPLHLKIQMFVRNLGENREFYRKLPDSLCSSEKLSAGNYDVCWNGTSLGAYTRPVSLQEFSIQASDNPETRVPGSRHRVLLTLSEKLENMTRRLHSRVIPKHSNIQSDGRATMKTEETSGYGTVASGDGSHGYDDDESGGSTYEPEDTDLEAKSGGTGRSKGVGGGEGEGGGGGRGVTLGAGVDFVFTEKSTSKSYLPYFKSSPPGVVVTFTHTASTGSTFSFQETGSLLLPALSTLILLRFFLMQRL